LDHSPRENPLVDEKNIENSRVLHSNQPIDKSVKTVKSTDSKQ
jgi:hypothetical protein